MSYRRGRSGKRYPPHHRASIGLEHNDILILFASIHRGKQIVQEGNTRLCPKKTLRMMAIDEAHLYAMHGRSFRVKICQLLPDLLKIVFADDKQHYTLCLVMMATMTQSLLTALSQLTNID